MSDTLQPYPAYKDSGVPWLGQIPAHWEVERARWLFEKMQRPTNPNDDVVTCFRDGTVTLRKNRRVSGFTESLKEIGYQGVHKGDLVIHAMDAFAGAIGVSDSYGKCTPVYAVCQPKRDLNVFFYAHIVREMSRSQWILALSKGIRERSTDFRYAEFAGQVIPLPPKSEQDAIARYLDHADRQIRRFIRAKRRTIELLNEQKQAIIHQAVTRGLDPHVPLKPSGIEWLGDVPEHWVIPRIKQVASLLRGKFTHRPRNDPSLYDGPYPFIQTGDVARASKHITSYKQTLNDKGLAVSKMFPSGTLVMTIAANIGDVAVLDFDACFPDSVIGLVPTEGLSTEYFFYLLRSMKPQLMLAAPITAQGNLNIERVGSMDLPLPPVQEQMVIASYIAEATESLEKSIAAIKGEIDLIREYRTRLITDVVTGKIDVRAAAQQLSDMAEEADPWDDQGESEEIEDADEMDVAEEVDA